MQGFVLSLAECKFEGACDSFVYTHQNKYEKFDSRSQQPTLRGDTPGSWIYR
jgi:hypothetical protein